MQTLTAEEARTWSREHRIDINGSGDPCFSDIQVKGIRLPLPKEPHKLPYLLVSLLDVEVDDCDEVSGAEHLFWMRSWEMWPKLSTSIGLDQFDAIRRGLGISEEISARPAVLFAGAEVKHLISCTLVPLVFGWDCDIIPSSAEFLISLSHDQYVQVLVRDDVVRSRLITELERWGPR
jgi:hypothetical protein